jgi:hypothetical protein
MLVILAHNKDIAITHHLIHIIASSIAALFKGSRQLHGEKRGGSW